MEIIIPAIPRAPIPEVFFSLLSSLAGVLLIPLDLWPGLVFWFDGGAPGGGGAAGPDLHELPSVLYL